MSNYFKHLSTYVCQKLVILFEKLSKKYNKILHHFELAKLARQNGLATMTDSNNPSGGDQTGAQVDGSITQDLVADFPVFEEVLRTILEIINACLTKNLVNNPNLVYTLLYNRKVFDTFLSNPAFQEVIINIETVLTYFSNRIESIERTPSVEEVFEIIKQSSLQWGSEKLKVINKIYQFKFITICLPFLRNSLSSDFDTLRTSNRKTFSFPTFGHWSFAILIFIGIRRIFCSLILSKMCNNWVVGCSSLILRVDFDILIINFQ